MAARDPRRVTRALGAGHGSVPRSRHEGHAFIDETLAAASPSPCLAPAVLINPVPASTAITTTYIAASGA